MGLTQYRKKRNFKVTREPRGGRMARHKAPTFVVQKHAASRLHYDFRLELDGVLKSWAVPKGPSLDPKTKRLAMHVEDHPLEYGDFEGIIPKGEYGGGTVLVWDRGLWQPADDAKRGYREGRLKFSLQGEKLHGNWMLVRKGGKRGDPNERHWFLFKENDEFAKPGSEITEEAPLSVVTGRDLEEIASQADRVWNSNGKVKHHNVKRKSKHKKIATPHPTPRNNIGNSNGHATTVRSRLRKSKTSSAKRQTSIGATLRRIGKKLSRIPNYSVQLATLVSEAPKGNDWLHEVKFDGYRMLCKVNDSKVNFLSRNGKDWTAKFLNLVAELKTLPIEDAVLDGEIVILGSDGRSSFQLLQNAFKAKAPPFVYFVFDLLFLNGFDVSDAAIEERKSLLRQIIGNNPNSRVQYSDHVIGNGPSVFADAAKLKLEGIICKRIGRPYTAGRGLEWLKVKCSLREEFVIGGFTKPGGSRNHFGALLLGFYNKKHELIYAGRVGTGFDDITLSSLKAKFDRLRQATSPFMNLAGRTGEARHVTWLRPQLVGQVHFSNWTNDGQLRHPSFQGLREDKAAKNVVRDDPVSPKVLMSTPKASLASKRKHSSDSNGRLKNGKAKRVAVEDDEVAGVRLSHPDKVLYPDAGITKLDLARYYEQISDWMLPQVENRLLSLVRCPVGSGQKCFFQRHPGDGTSEHLLRTQVDQKKKAEVYLSVNNLPGLISLVQMGVLEIHVWGSKTDKIDKPDRLILDLDPDPSVSWLNVVTAAKEVRLLLQELELESFLKTTGGKGLHIVVPIQRRISWEEAKTFCFAVANFLVAAAPDRFIAKMSKAARKNKIFIDYLRNDKGATAIAAYSTRNRPGAPVSVPIAWDELNGKLKSDHFNIENLPARLAKLNADPWAKIHAVRQSITKSMTNKLKQRSD